jgi:NAD-dependent SIR2 family protein deacetylase
MTEDYSKRIERAARAIYDSKKLVIGAGAGLSAAAGLEYNGRRFTENFKPFIEKYEMQDLYTSSFYPFNTQEEKWAYWARHISLNRYETQVTELYQELLELVSSKEYFVITTNVESQFEKAGFEKAKIFEVQGNYAWLQCGTACHDKLYYNEQIISGMLEQISDCRIPSYLVPKCPFCGGNMEVNLRKDKYFVQDNNWYNSESNYEKFIYLTKDKPTVFLELGVGYNTPGIIRFPFEIMVKANHHAVLIRINRDYLNGMRENEGSTVSFCEDMMTVIKDFKSSQIRTAINSSVVSME